MKKLLVLLVAVMALGTFSCKTMQSQKQKNADLNAIFESLRNSLPGSDVTYNNGRVKIILGELVYFKTGSANINETSSANLDKLADILKKYPRTSVDLNGYTDNTGTKATNDQLSLDRANSVKNYLISRGVQQRRMLTKGFADQYPVGNNNTEEGRQQNRRVEFLIYY